eukprot:Blabericola_migrator_1__1975@NODE_153_length_12753_cov_114_743891_g134_i0_p5_GENE_NODE_153_length_12753_cov_114_743891_g134_i0NODE_153_length_12753_cov_114_743891_g134_i0_p5_ORF_typecomplete_len306_score31_74_NODE_153_length_12753_cov_114_743891_g134_i037104627
MACSRFAPHGKARRADSKFRGTSLLHAVSVLLQAGPMQFNEAVNYLKVDAARTKPRPPLVLKLLNGCKGYYLTQAVATGVAEALQRENASVSVPLTTEVGYDTVDGELKDSESVVVPGTNMSRAAHLFDAAFPAEPAGARSLAEARYKAGIADALEPYQISLGEIAKGLLKDEVAVLVPQSVPDHGTAMGEDTVDAPQWAPGGVSEIVRVDELDPTEQLLEIIDIYKMSKNVPDAPQDAPRIPNSITALDVNPERMANVICAAIGWRSYLALLTQLIHGNDSRIESLYNGLKSHLIEPKITIVPH